MENRKNKNLLGQAFDVGTGNNISLNEMRELVNKSLPNLQFEYIEERVGDVKLTRANIQPLLDLGWAPRVDITEGVKECFEEFVDE